MDCRRCRTPLEKPGDYCLTCETGNCDAVVVVFERDRATLTLLRDEEGGGGGNGGDGGNPDDPDDPDDPDTVVVGETTITTVPESGGETGVVELRNFAGRVADELRRKRPDEVYAAAAAADRGDGEPDRPRQQERHRRHQRGPHHRDPESTHCPHPSCREIENQSQRVDEDDPGRRDRQAGNPLGRVVGDHPTRPGCSRTDPGAGESEGAPPSRGT